MPKETEDISNMAWITDATAETFKENAQVWFCDKIPLKPCDHISLDKSIKFLSWQGIYQLANILSTPMQGQCNLLSLDTFKDEVDIPFLKQVPKIVLLFKLCKYNGL